MERLAKRFSLQLYKEFEIAEIPYIRYRFSSKSLELYCCNKKWIPALETLYKLLTHQYHIESLTEFVEGDSRLFAISWDRGLTEQQENDFDYAEVYEVKRKERVIFDYVRKDTHD